MPPESHDWRMAIDEVKASSWRDVEDWISDVAWARAVDQPRATAVYRGVASPRFALETSLGRRGGSYASREKHLFRNFRKYAYRHGRPDWSEWNWLALAQHYGLPTRLLDWSFSPLIALHFATDRYPDLPGMVWAVDYSRVHEQVPDALRPYREEGALVFTTDMLAAGAPTIADFDRLAGEGQFAVFFEPPSIEDRIANQSAVLSVMSGPPTVNIADWFGQHPGVARRLSLPPGLKKEVRERLDQNGITERMLFPGLSGLAAWLARYYSDQGIEPDPLERDDEVRIRDARENEPGTGI